MGLGSEQTSAGSVARRVASRRSVVRAGLWTVPAVTVATAAPAFATSGAATLSVPTAEFWWASWPTPPAEGWFPVITVRNDAPVAASGISVTVTFPSGYTPPALATLPYLVNAGDVGAGWSTTVNRRLRKSDPYSVTFSLSAALGAGAVATIGTPGRTRGFGLLWSQAASGMPVARVTSAADTTGVIVGLVQVAAP